MRISDWSSDVCSSDLNALGNDDDIYVYTDLSTAVPGTPFKLKGHVGYSDGSLAPPAGAQSGNYWDWSVGAEASYRMLTLGVSYVDTVVGHTWANPAGSGIGRAHVCTPVTKSPLVCRLLLEKKNQHNKQI